MAYVLTSERSLVIILLLWNIIHVTLAPNNESEYEESGDDDQRPNTYLRELSIPPIPPRVYYPVTLVLFAVIIYACSTVIGCIIYYKQSKQEGEEDQSEEIRRNTTNRDDEESVGSWQLARLNWKTNRSSQLGGMSLSEGEDQSVEHRGHEMEKGEGNQSSDATLGAVGTANNKLTQQSKRMVYSNPLATNFTPDDFDSLPPDPSGKLAVSPPSATHPGQTNQMSRGQREGQPKRTRKINKPHSHKNTTRPAETSTQLSPSKNHPSDQETNPEHRSSIVHAKTFDSMGRVRKDSKECLESSV